MAVDTPVSGLGALGPESLLGESLPPVRITFGLGRYWVALHEGDCGGSLPLAGLVLLVDVLAVDCAVSQETGVDACPLLVDALVLVTAKLDLLDVNLARVNVDVNVRVIGVPMDCAERHRLREVSSRNFVVSSRI